MFTVNAKSYTTPFSFFRIHFEQIYLRVEERQLSLMHKSYAALSNENLKAYTNNPQLRPENIQYELARPPSMGNFYRMDLQQFTRHMDFANLTPLSYGESFTQQDINSGSVYYNLKASAYENVKDFTDLRVSTLGTSAKNVRLWIEFVPQKNDVTFVNNGLKDVIEGGRKYIDRDDLYLQTDKFRVFEFTVISRPHYGVLHLIDPRSAAIVSHDVGKFTTDDIRDTRLVYQHDDSEHGSDSFTFTAVPDISKTSPSHGNIPEFTGTFDIQMLMRNDNPPERKVDKVFTVERNGQKLLTIRDLAFIDPDIDYDPWELLYTRRRVSNGQFISARNGSQIYQFKQVDLVNNEIMFKHSGEDIGRADIAVTDGQFYSNCMMQIQAGEPFIQIDTNTGIKVRNGRREKVTIGNLSIETNMNLADTEVHFVLFEGPRNGFLEVDGVKVDEFIFKNLKMQNLVYKHKGKSNEEDYFAFTLIAKDIQVNWQLLHSDIVRIVSDTT
ncbi:hypothetical protein DPMN_110443 [Dreissena polymorpha]|uniref:Uncharacterized protein n=1 Tax=Dreissena polymorpha TaxID=45954 RepID=A0A9D4KC16_DREPO|nr:hypothetical protein DPMN_110443 [Dreissena polymorpha]